MIQPSIRVFIDVEHEKQLELVKEHIEKFTDNIVIGGIVHTVFKDYKFIRTHMFTDIPFHVYGKIRTNFFDDSKFVIEYENGSFDIEATRAYSIDELELIKGYPCIFKVMMLSGPRIIIVKSYNVG